MLVCSNLSVRYESNREWTLKNVNVKVFPGELVLIVGASGSGKTTLAKVFSGLVPNFYPAEVKGEVRIFGKNPGELEPLELIRLIGFLPQNPTDYVLSLIVEEEIVYLLENLALDRDEIRNRLEKWLEALKIEHLRYRLTTELSDGELQKVYLASLLSAQPKGLILDEPFARLDPTSAQELSTILRRLADEGLAIMVTEHHLDDVLPLADRVYFLSEGRVVAEGNPKEVVKYLKEVDIPEITEAFFELEKLGIRVEKPLSLSEALEVVQRYVGDS